MQIKSCEHLVSNLLPAEGCVILAGDSKTGKSTLSLELARAVVTGSPALEALPAMPGAAIYWQADDGSKERFIRNFREAFHGQPIKGFEVCFDALPLFGGGLEMLDKALGRTRAKLAIVDSLIAIRNTRDQAEDFVRTEYAELRALSDLGRTHHCLVLVLHHYASGRRAAGSNPMIGMAGSFGVTAGVDGLIALTLLSLTRAERILTVVTRDSPPQKMIYGRDPAGRLFHIGFGEWADYWDEALMVYRSLRDRSTIDGTDVAEALGVADRNGRVRLARWRMAGIVEDMGGRKHAWTDAFMTAAGRLEGAK